MNESFGTWAASRHLLVRLPGRPTCADLFIYTYSMRGRQTLVARLLLLTAASACEWIFQWELRKRWRIVDALIRCVYTLTARLFSDLRRRPPPPLYVLYMRRPRRRICWASVRVRRAVPLCSHRDAALCYLLHGSWKYYSAKRSRGFANYRRALGIERIAPTTAQQTQYRDLMMRIAIRMLNLVL